MAQEQSLDQKPKWWKSGYAWMVFSGPALVVVASLTTVYIAVSGQDPVLAHEENSGFTHSTDALTPEQKKMHWSLRYAHATMQQPAPINLSTFMLTLNSRHANSSHL